MSVRESKYKKACALIAMAIGGLLFWSCIGSDYSDCAEVEASTKTTYFTLTISADGASAQSRTNPTGGNDGDGREWGINNENNIYNLNLILFDTDEADTIHNISNPKLRHLYIDGLNLSSSSQGAMPYHTATFKVDGFSFSAQSQLLVVANAGNLSDKQINSLDDLRTYLYTDEVYRAAQEVAQCNRFVMTSAKPSTVITVQDGVLLGSEANPVRISATIERMASRIDLVPSATLKEGYYEYGVNNGSADKVRITHITPFNVWRAQAGQYMLKRVSTTGSYSDQSILGAETPQVGVQTNYVLSPYILNMNGAEKSAAFWNQNATKVKEWYANHIDNVQSFLPIKAVTNTDAAGNSYYILGYTQENTMLIQNQLHCFTTGVVLQANYIPEKVYRADGTTLSNYNAGSDFWLLNGKFYAEAVAGATM